MCAATAALAAAAAIGACGGGGPSSVTRTRTAPLPPVLPVTPRPPRRRAKPTARSPALQHLQAVILDTLHPLGSQIGVLVVDLSTGETLFTRNPQLPRPPASLEKLYTSVAALRLLGPDARLHTVVFGTGHLSAHGVWHGNLYLRGDGDPTLGDGTFNRIEENGAGPTLSQIAAQLRHDGIHRVTGRLYGDESRFDRQRGGPLTDGAPDLPDYGGELGALVFDHGATGPGSGSDPAVFATHELALTMRAQGIEVKASTHPRKTPAGAHKLAVVASPPLTTLLSLMDIPSDDLFADLLCKQLGWHFLGHGTLAAGAIEIRQLLASDYRLHPTLFDGSGLDKADRSSPQQIVDLLRRVQGTPTGTELSAALPVVGEDGTVSGFGLRSYAVGHCVAKTGSLNEVTNLAGLCRSRGENQIAFAVMIDGPQNWQAFAALSRVVGAIGNY